MGAFWLLRPARHYGRLPGKTTGYVRSGFHHPFLFLQCAGVRPGRYHTLEWLNYIATELHKGFTPLFRPDTPETLKPAVRAGLEKKLQYVDESLSDDQWICGQRFTIADAYLFTVLRWAYGVKLNMDGLTHIESYMQRVAKRPTVAAALKAEGLN